jgi:hypothetical protein
LLAPIEPVGDEIDKAQNDDHALREGGPDDTGDDGEGRDDPVVRAVDEIGEIVARKPP